MTTDVSHSNIRAFPASGTPYTHAFVLDDPDLRATPLKDVATFFLLVTKVLQNVVRTRTIFNNDDLEQINMVASQAWYLSNLLTDHAKGNPMMTIEDLYPINNPYPMIRQDLDWMTKSTTDINQMSVRVMVQVGADLDTMINVFHRSPAPLTLSLWQRIWGLLTN